MPLNEVLQLTRVYQSVEQGKVAKKADMKEAFGKMKEDDIILEILKFDYSVVRSGLMTQEWRNTERRERTEGSVRVIEQGHNDIADSETHS